MRHLLSAAFCLVGLLCVGCASQPAVEFRSARFEPADGLKRFLPPGDTRHVYVASNAIFTEADFICVERATTEDGRSAVSVTLNEAAAERMYQFTSQNLRQPMAFFLDGELLIAPIVLSPIRANVMITGNKEGLTPAQADRLIAVVGQKK